MLVITPITLLYIILGVDYEGFHQIERGVHFYEGNVSTTIEIAILNDDLAEGVEMFIGEIVAMYPSDNFTANITVEIVDDEGTNTIILKASIRSTCYIYIACQVGLCIYIYIIYIVKIKYDQ